MEVPFNQLSNFVLCKWVSKNPTPFLRQPIQVRDLPESDGFHGGIRLRIRVNEIKGKNRLERSLSRGFLGFGVIVLRLGFLGFGEKRKGRVVSVLG
uniref:Uncharacterized protein n=1 Tax=Cannabis sativa TaxID=3483 RepID=A0A803NJU6_CANSA